MSNDKTDNLESKPKPKREVKLTEYLRESLDKVALSEGFKKYEVIVDQGSSVGDGFVGLLYKATVKEINSDKKLEIVLKCPPLNKARREDFHSMLLFEREVFAYNEVFPELVKIQREKKIDESEGFYNFPKCYFAECNKEKDDAVIIMEDLKTKDFKMWDKYLPVNLEHTKLVVAALGRYSVVGHVIVSKIPA